MLKALLLLLMKLALRAMALAALLALAGMAMAQTNLVLNGSFEDTVDCAVPMASQLPKANHWYNPTNATPDLYDCDMERECGYTMDLPYWNGFMLSQDGLRHSGFYPWDGPFATLDGREYMMVELSDVLVAGETYEVSLWYALRRPFQYGVDHIGVWFGSEAVQEDTIGPISLVPQIRLEDPDNAHLGESETWTRLVDTLVAQGGERWLVIGNFDPIALVDGSLVNPNGFESSCYYYVDNVVVRLLQPNGIGELKRPKLWWNGQAWQVSGLVHEGEVTLEVYNMLGALVHRQRVTTEGDRLVLAYDPPIAGSYFLSVSWANGRMTVRFIK